MVTNEQIEQIRARADILRIIGAHVQLRKQGQRYTGLCPFHSEKSPSFSVSADKGLFYCFGCHVRGDVFSFVEQMQGLDFPSAARWLAKEVGVELTAESPAEAKRRKLEGGVAEVNRYALAFFQHEIWAKDGAIARRYLEERAIPEEQARERGLGYGGAPGKLLGYLTAKKISPEAAQRAGLLNESGDRSLFDERLIFPIVDQHGRIAGFGGRWLADTKIDGERTRPKYVNTRESALFSKRTLLYGWDVAQPAVRRGKRVVICEGYTDVLACQRAGIDDAVAALGTAFTSEHAGLVRRLASDAIILLDSDAAGERASKEAAEKCIAAGLKTLIAPLPPGDDPDSVVRKSGAKALGLHVNVAKPAIEHFIDRAFAAPGMGIEDKARAAQALWPLFKALGQSLERDLYMAQLANRVGIDTAQLQKHFDAAETEDRIAANRKAQADARKAKAEGRGPATDYRRSTTDDRPPNPDSRSPTSEDRPTTHAGPQEPPKPTLNRVEAKAVVDLIVYPTLRGRLSELYAVASDVLRPILEDLAASMDPPAAFLAAHGLAHLAQQAEKLAAVIASGADAESGQVDRAERILGEVLKSLQLQRSSEERKAARKAIREAEARGESSSEHGRRHKDLTELSHKLKRPG